MRLLLVGADSEENLGMCMIAAAAAAHGHKTQVIGFDQDDAYMPVDICPKPTTNDTWSLWSHEWTPSAPGDYKILLRVGDRSIATRRLDLYYYIRGVRVDEV